MTIQASHMALRGAISSALKTLASEKQGLKALEAALLGNLSSSFETAVQTIRNARGHVVITGLGKSGHIGTKIAATLASTGTPAFLFTLQKPIMVILV